MKLDGNSLHIEDLNAALDNPTELDLTPTAWDRVSRGRAVVEKVLKSGETVYGINTGFGRLANQRIERDQQRQLQKNLLRSHASGVGELVSRRLSRLILLLKINSLAKGNSGVRVELIRSLLALYNAGIAPAIHSRGSVGASGDLAPLADLALPLIGEGFCLSEDDQPVPALEVLTAHKLEPLELAEKEGLSLINGTQLSTALAIDGFLRSWQLFHAFNAVGAFSTEVLLGSDVPFRAELSAVRAHPGQVRSAEILYGLMKGSGFREAHIHCDRVQDFYSLRCMPQVHGPFYDLLMNVKGTLEIEINSTTDNPVVLLKTEEILSGGNFHAAPMGHLMDYLAIAVADCTSMCERRVSAYQDTVQSQLPMFLTAAPGLNSGFMMAHVSAAALTADNRILAHPASVDSLPTSANQEDHVSMAPSAGWKLKQLLDQSELVLAIEYLCACQATDLHNEYTLGKASAELHSNVRKAVPFFEKDHSLSEPIESVANILRTFDWADFIQRRVGGV